MCSRLFSKGILPKLLEQRQREDQADVVDNSGGGGTVSRPTPEATTPVPTDTASGGSGLRTELAKARLQGVEARDNAGLVAGEADVDVASDGDASELDPTTGRRRPTRASFMSQSRGGAGLKV